MTRTSKITWQIQRRRMPLFSVMMRAGYAGRLMAGTLAAAFTGLVPHRWVPQMILPPPRNRPIHLSATSDILASVTSCHQDWLNGPWRTLVRVSTGIAHLSLADAYCFSIVSSHCVCTASCHWPNQGSGFCCIRRPPILYAAIPRKLGPVSKLPAFQHCGACPPHNETFLAPFRSVFTSHLFTDLVRTRYKLGIGFHGPHFGYSMSFWMCL